MFCQKDIYKWVRNEFGTKKLSLKHSPWNGNLLTLFSKEKFLSAAVSKEGHAESLFGYERNHYS